MCVKPEYRSHRAASAEMCEQSEQSELSPGEQKARKTPPVERRALRVRGRNPGHTKLDTFCDGFGFEKANLFA